MNDSVFCRGSQDGKVGMAEINLDWRLVKEQDRLPTRTREWWTQQHVIHDPVSSEDSALIQKITNFGDKSFDFVDSDHQQLS